MTRKFILMKLRIHQAAADIFMTESLTSKWVVNGLAATFTPDFCVLTQVPFQLSIACGHLQIGRKQRGTLILMQGQPWNGGKR